MVIDNTYFENGELFIPNNKDISAQPMGTPSVQSDLDLFIDKYERQLLMNALGITLYDELTTAMDDIDIAAQKWQDLVNGANYTLNGKTHRWEGLRGYAKQSLIAFYIHAKYLREKESTFTTTGMVRNTAANAESVSFTAKYVKIWNEFITQYQAQLNSTVPNIIINRSGMVGLDFYGQTNVNVSLWQYLNDANEIDDTSFPDFEFRFYESVNSFGI